MMRKKEAEERRKQIDEQVKRANYQEAVVLAEKRLKMRAIVEEDLN